MLKDKIAHVTSVHPYDDIRIFHKQCMSLKSKYETHLFNKDYSGEIDGIILHKLPFVKNKFIRLISSWLIALIGTSFKNFKVIHFHDPELLFAVPFWKLSGKKIIYDVHENYYKQFSARKNFNKVFKKIILTTIRFIEFFFSLFADKIVFVIEKLSDSLERKGKTLVIGNEPIIESTFTETKRKKQFIYVGNISEERGILKLVYALKKHDTKLILAGPFSSRDFQKKILEFENVKYLGIINRDKIKKVISESIAGFCTLYPTPNHLNSSPNKFFEYLAYGTPVIASNFKKWVEFVPDYNKFVFYVDPLKDNEIESAITNLLEKNDQTINQLGMMGYKYVKSNFNWSLQEKKLLKCYQDIISKSL